jgi:thioredoxin reductase
MEYYDVTVLGAGPAGLAAALSAHKNGANTLIIEREEKLGGILKQCIHDGFGLIRFQEKLSGPEYAQRYIDMVTGVDIPILTSTFAAGIEKTGDTFDLTLVDTEEGLSHVQTSALVLACGCRERTARQISIHGARPAGVLTAGTAQYFVNILGCLPCKRCVILGSGDIGLIMARRLTLEGAQVLGVYEAKSAPSGLTRNIVQCLQDYGIPLHLSRTVTRVFGEDRVEGVEISQVDENMNPIPGTETRVDCDGVILSVGLIPENEPAESLGVPLDDATRGPYVDQNFMTRLTGAFSCGNALHVSDLVDYVSESGEIAGGQAAAYVQTRHDRRLIAIAAVPDFLYAVPQHFDTASANRKIVLYFRAKETEENARVQIMHGDKVLFDKKYPSLKPPEMKRIELDLSDESFGPSDTLEIAMVRK